MNIKNYINAKKDLELVKINIETLNNKEKHLKDIKNSLKELELKLENNTKKIESKLKDLKGIEQELFYSILVEGINPTKAVDNVAFKNDKDPSTIWKNYYPKVKKILKEVGYYASENPVE